MILSLLLTASSRAGLVYTWAAYKDGTQDFSIVSRSKQFYSFKLSAFALAVNSVYTFVLTVLDTSSLQSSVKTITVNVEPSNIVAVISGGIDRAILLGSSLTIDASQSYDQDQQGKQSPV